MNAKKNLMKKNKKEEILRTKNNKKKQINVKMTIPVQTNEKVY